MNTHIRDNFLHLIPTEYFVPVAYGSGGIDLLFGDIYTYGLNGANDYCSFTFRMPNDFLTLTSIKVLLIANLTGNFDWTATTDFGASTESYNNHSDSATADAQAATASKLLELDLSDAFTGLAANDIVGCMFVLDALVTITNLGVIGLNVKYT